jgi:D-arabinose 5-phosphate isomerase GutQ
VVLSAIFDAVQAALIEKTDFRNEQFAKIHPAGAVGKKLNS